MKMRSLLLWIGLVIAMTAGVAGLITTLRPVAAQGSSIDTTLLVSVASDGTPANGTSAGVSLSPNGRHVAFDSWATNLVISDTNSAYDVFVHDLETQRTTRASEASGGTQGSRSSGLGVFSADGRYIAFTSEASNLVPNDTNERNDVFVHDQQTGETTRVSVASDGVEANRGAGTPSISADGRYVTFSSSSANLTSDPIGEGLNVFVHDRSTGETTMVSGTITDAPPNGSSDRPALSADGRLVAFQSLASNLVASDTNNNSDIFVHDREIGETTLVSMASDGTQAKDDSSPPSISADGRFVVFSSRADNLVSDDTNDFCPIDGSHANCQDIFVHDLRTRQTERVSVTSEGGEANASSGISYMPSAISADGRYIAFLSHASNLVPDDTNDVADIFIHDRVADQTERVSLAADGSQSDATLLSPVLDISDDGRTTAFSTDAKLVNSNIGAGLNVYVRIRSEVPSAVGVLSPLAISHAAPARLLLVGSGVLLLMLALGGTRQSQHAPQPPANE